MARKRSKQASSDPTPALAAAFRGAALRWTLALIILLVALGGLAYAWQRWGASWVAHKDLPLTLDKIEITGQPSWIRVDVKSEVFRDGSLGELSFLDKQLAYKVYRAFVMHAWVAQVDRVGKRPSGRVVVDLHYRRPVAWVEIPGDVSSIRQDSLLPIDEEAVVLDPQDMGEEVAELLRISISGLPPYGLEGTRWGDPRLLGAAKLAALLEGSWRELGIQRIRALSSLDSRRRQVIVYELVRGSQQRIVWGSAPGQEAANEPRADEKLRRLRRTAARGQVSGSQQWPLDLRVANAEPAIPRTANSAATTGN